MGTFVVFNVTSLSPFQFVFVLKCGWKIHLISEMTWLFILPPGSIHDSHDDEKRSLIFVCYLILTSYQNRTHFGAIKASFTRLNIHSGSTLTRISLVKPFLRSVLRVVHEWLTQPQVYEEPMVTWSCQPSQAEIALRRRRSYCIAVKDICTLLGGGKYFPHRQGIAEEPRNRLFPVERYHDSFVDTWCLQNYSLWKKVSHSSRSTEIEKKTTQFQ